MGVHFIVSPHLLDLWSPTEFVALARCKLHSVAATTFGSRLDS